MTNKQRLAKMSSKELGEFLINTNFCALLCPERKALCNQPNEECIRKSIDWLLEESEEKMRWLN